MNFGQPLTRYALKQFWITRIYQYRTLHRILGTKDHLHKLNFSESYTCLICGQQHKNITHLFARCQIVLDLWKNITWFELKLSIKIKLNELDFIFGYQKYDQNVWSLNFILLITQSYIFHCSKYRHDFNIYHLKNLIKEKYLEQNTLSKLNNTQHIFSKKWSTWKILFEEKV